MPAPPRIAREGQVPTRSNWTCRDCANALAPLKWGTLNLAQVPDQFADKAMSRSGGERVVNGVSKTVSTSKI